MSLQSEYRVFDYATDDLGAAGDNTVIFRAADPLQVVEVGVHVSVNFVPGGASVAICDFDITSASLGPSGAEVTAPARATASATLTSPSDNVTVQDGKVISKKVNFSMAKGETLICQMTGTPTSGTGFPYIKYRLAGESVKEPGEQRSGVAAE